MRDRERKEEKGETERRKRRERETEKGEDGERRRRAALRAALAGRFGGAARPSPPFAWPVRAV